MTEPDSYSSIVETLLLDRERGIRLSRARTRATDALAAANTTHEVSRDQVGDHAFARGMGMTCPGMVLTWDEPLHRLVKEILAFPATAGAPPRPTDTGPWGRARIASTVPRDIAVTPMHSGPHLGSTIEKNVNTLTSPVTIELCHNDNRVSSRMRTVNVQIIDSSDERVYWDRTVSGHWAGTWTDRPDLGVRLLEALERAGLKPAGIHIGDDEAYSKRIVSIDSAAESLRRFGCRVLVKR
jgi:hypothetical protein